MAPLVNVESFAFEALSRLLYSQLVVHELAFYELGCTIMDLLCLTALITSTDRFLSIRLGIPSRHKNRYKMSKELVVLRATF